MKRWGLRIAAFLAFAFLGLTVLNAQWLADEPKGSVKLITQRGLGPSGECTDGAPYHGIAPNSAASIVRADSLGAAMVAVPVSRDATGGPILAQAASCGASDGAALAEVIPLMGRHGRFLFDLRDGDRRMAGDILDLLADLGRDPIERRDGFVGTADTLAVVRERAPEAWAWDPAEARACANDYILLGWSGYLPQSCREGTMLVPLDAQFSYWGWPNRLLARMEAHAGEVVVALPGDDPEGLVGIDLPEQLGEVPASFNGYLWVEDGFIVLPALYPSFDRRTQDEIDEAARALQARRSAR